MQLARHVVPSPLAIGAACLLAAAVAQGQALEPCGEGLKRFAAQDYAGARGLLEGCLAGSPDNVEVLMALTVVTATQGAFDVAVAHGGRLVGLVPDNPNARYWYGRALLGAGRVPEAQAQWEAGIALTQSHAGILEGLGRLALERSEYAKAYNLIKQIQLQGVTEGWVDRLLADIARHQGLWARAADHWADGLTHDGETADGLVTLGELRLVAGDHPRAIAAFHRAVALESTGEAWAGLGEAYFAANQPDSAEVALRRAIDLAPKEPRQRFNLANVLEISGRTEEAGEQFARYVALAPDDAMGHLNFGIHLEKRGEYARALAEATRALEIDSTMTPAWLTRARSLEQLGRREEAAAAVAELARLNPGAQADLELWRADLLEQEAPNPEGKILLAHLVTGDPLAVEPLTKELAAGVDFGELAQKYSQGPTAAQGGTIGWVDPQTMAAPLREVIEELGVGETSPLVESGGLHHAFKRIR